LNLQDHFKSTQKKSTVLKVRSFFNFFTVILFCLNTWNNSKQFFLVNSIIYESIEWWHYTRSFSKNIWFWGKGWTFIEFFFDSCINVDMIWENQFKRIVSCDVVIKLLVMWLRGLLCCRKKMSRKPILAKFRFNFKFLSQLFILLSQKVSKI